ncbi:MAG: STAS domain-containing protein [Rhodocyclaceae bacterium]|jgi:SulP family sulfate permease|nr:STAS domain-containing protein [Rhodocyclaceae bacterium]
MHNPLLKRLLPFLRWLPYSSATLRADFIAGLTVALVLVPQSMAYAQLAGMPPYYGLYAAFLPVMVAALWGSSNQLGTGPVAVVSLLTASSLSVFAAPGSEQFIALAVMLALLVGLVQLSLGAFKLGVVVNFLSHPVIVGFTNAAALIIGLSQLNKILGVPMGRSEHFIQDIWGVLLQAGDTHLPTFVMGVVAIAIIAATRKYAPKLPGVLIAVALATLASWQIGFEQNAASRIEEVVDAEARVRLDEYAQAELRIAELGEQIAAANADLSKARKEHGPLSQEAAALNYQLEVLTIQVKDREKENRERNRTIRRFVFERVASADGQSHRLHLAGRVPAGEKSDGSRWRIRRISHGELSLKGGGDVVGTIPEGLPSFSIPKFSWDMFGTLLSTAIVISLVGFMEAISIAKAMAAKTKQKIDPNQELIGQGLANLVGAASQSFPVSGSFSRSAVNINAGAITGMSSVFTGLFVLITLLALTPLLYHLPQAVLAAVIIMAVIGLINFTAVKHAWQANRHDGIAAIVTFIATLGFAPHLDNGIMVGAGLAIMLYLLRTMKPRVAILGRHPDGTLRDASVHNLPASEIVTAVRFDGRLYFANVSFFEDAILEAVARNPKAKYLLVVGDGINELDASGEEVMHHLVERLRSSGVNMVFAGFKKQVVDVMRATGLLTVIGETNFYINADRALEAISATVTAEGIEGAFCLLPQK